MCRQADCWAGWMRVRAPTLPVTPSKPVADSSLRRKVSPSAAAETTASSAVIGAVTGVVSSAVITCDSSHDEGLHRLPALMVKDCKQAGCGRRVRPRGQMYRYLVRVG